MYISHGKLFFSNVADFTLYLLICKFVTFVKRLKTEEGICRDILNMGLL